MYDPAQAHGAAPADRGHGPLTADQANAVYDVLVAHAGARNDEDARQQFVYHLTDGCTEYQVDFGRHLGKFRAEPDRWYVIAYRDMTPERAETIDRVNAVLAEMYAAATAGESEA